MTYEEFRDQAIRSAELYYDYLEQEGKGVAETRVSSVSLEGNGYVKLILSGRLASTDDTLIRVLNRVYSTDEIKPVRYDRDERSLLLHPRSEFLSVFHDTAPKEVTVISDLRFLVRRVGTWYESHTASLTLPVTRPAPLIELPPLSVLPSEEQNCALSGILRSPISYVWGAPGTGKTQLVLARAVLSYCLQRKKILITAPTNNAVEQTLKGVLCVLEEAGIPLTSVLRLGVPSSEFYDRYPMVCEIQSVEKRLSLIEEDLAFYQRAALFFATRSWYADTSAFFVSTKSKIEEIRRQQEALSAERQRIDSAYKIKNARFAPAVSNLELKQSEYDRVLSQVKKKRSWLGRLLSKKALEKAKEQLSKLDNELSELSRQYDSLSPEIEALTNQRKLNADACDRLITELSASISLMQSLPPCPIHSYCNFGDMKQLSSDGATEYLELFHRDLTKLGLLLHEREPVYLSVDVNSISNKLRILQEEKESLAVESVAARLQDCLVVASTVDGYISKLSDNDAFQPCHVFLDEAAYCPLIKGVTLLSASAPLTMLGDHKQLPPVCEASQKYIKTKNHGSVRLWEAPALYLEDVFSCRPEELITKLQKADPPSFLKIQKYDLIHTYRFGDSLAKVLDRFVYHSSFHGNEHIGTLIYYFSVAKESSEGCRKHQNREECAAIRQILNSIGEFSYAVLTPYRAQRDLLINGYANPDDVFTIHGSQGREWDTVILSIVETTDSWFLHPLLINTAVSRAKKQLILVCDVNYWLKQKQHIIGGLLSVAAPFPEG